MSHPLGRGSGSWRLLAWAMVVAVGCGKSGPGSVGPAGPGELAVTVENQFAASLTIFLEVGGPSRRLGQVNIQETRAFVVPWSRVGTGLLRLRAEVIGSDERVVTEDLRIQPGQMVHWTLAPQLNMSTVSFF